jgi:hypothetical protein
MMSVVSPDGLRTEPASIQAELAGVVRGHIRVDPAPRAAPPDDRQRREPGDVNVALKADGPGYRDLFLSTISSQN